jgi:hypothetical protein
VSAFPEIPLEPRVPAVPDLERVVERLVRDFPQVGEQSLRDVVEEIAVGYRGVRVRQYVGIFVERESRERLLRSVVPRPRSAAGPRSAAAPRSFA